MLLCCDIVDSVANRSVACEFLFGCLLLLAHHGQDGTDKIGRAAARKQEEQEQEDAVELSSQSSHIPRKG
jgi:hypothetical protein